MEGTIRIGYLGRGGTLYCSRICAASRGEHEPDPVDEEEYDGLCESGRLQPELLCPVCGSEFAVTWPDRESE